MIITITMTKLTAYIQNDKALGKLVMIGTVKILELMANELN